MFIKSQAANKADLLAQQKLFEKYNPRNTLSKIIFYTFNTVYLNHSSQLILVRIKELVMPGMEVPDTKEITLGTGNYFDLVEY